MAVEAWELANAFDEDVVSGSCALEVVEEIFVFHAGLGLPFFATHGRRTGDDACDFESADQSHPRAGAWRSIPGDFRLPPPVKAPILQP